MKTSYQLQPKRRSTSKRTFGIALSITLVLFAIYGIFPNFFSRIVRVAFTPIQKSFHYVGHSISQSRIVSSKKTLVDENIRLKKQNDALEEKLLSFDTITAQNEELKRALQIRSIGNNVGGVVTLIPPGSPFDVFDVEFPGGSNVSVGNRVQYGVIALGSVKEVYSSHARVLLYSSPKVETEGRLIKNGTPLQLVGKGAGNFTVSAPRDLAIAPDDIVSLGQNPDLVLAKVRSVEEVETDSFKTVRLSVPTNIWSLRYVDIHNESY